MPSPIPIGSSVVQEQPDSPEWIYGDSLVVNRSFRGTYAACRLAQPLRGAAGTGAFAGLVVAESRVRKERGGLALLSIRYEWGSTAGEPPQGSTLPPDECEVTMEKLDRALEQHSGFSSTVEDVELEAIKELLANKENHDKEHPEDGRPYGVIVAENPDAWALYQMKLRAHTHYSLWVPNYRWRIHSWDPPVAEEGGWSEVPDGPITPPPNLDWIRAGDTLAFNGSTWVLERSWIGGPDLNITIYPPAS